MPSNRSSNVPGSRRVRYFEFCSDGYHFFSICFLFEDNVSLVVQKRLAGISDGILFSNLNWRYTELAWGIHRIMLIHLAPIVAVVFLCAKSNNYFSVKVLSVKIKIVKPSGGEESKCIPGLEKQQ